MPHTRQTAQPAPRNMVQALNGVLRLWGYDAQDFVVEEDHHSELGRFFQLTGGILKVTRRSTGEQRLYATGIESGWLSALIRDLARGHLADAPEAAPAPLVDVVLRQAVAH